MAGKLKDLSIGNRYRRIDIYANLPEKLDRLKTNRPVGLKHAKSNDVAVIANRFFTVNREV